MEGIITIGVYNDNKKVICIKIPFPEQPETFKIDISQLSRSQVIEMFKEIDEKINPEDPRRGRGVEPEPISEEEFNQIKESIINDIKNGVVGIYLLDKMEFEEAA